MRTHRSQPAAAAVGAVAAAATRSYTRLRREKSRSAAEEEKGDPRAEIIRENNFGVALMNRQQFEQALGKFQRACILDPQSDVGCLNTGIAFLNMQRFDEARQILEKAAQRDPRDPTPGSIWACSKRPRATRTPPSRIF